MRNLRTSSSDAAKAERRRKVAAEEAGSRGEEEEAPGTGSCGGAMSIWQERGDTGWGGGTMGGWRGHTKWHQQTPRRRKPAG